MRRRQGTLLAMLVCSLSQLGIEYGEAPERKPAPRAVEPVPQLEQEGPREEEWRQRQVERQAALRAARGRLEKAKEARRMLGDRYSYRGKPRAAIIAELDEAKRELAQAERLLAELREEARRADVPPGWLSDDEVEGEAELEAEDAGVGEGSEPDEAGDEAADEPAQAED